MRITLDRSIMRAPVAGAQTADTAMSTGGSEEPFMVTLRQTKERGVQIPSWFVPCVRHARIKTLVGAPGLEMEVEDYERAFLRRTRRCGWQHFRLTEM
jgi:hypothetical protein